jgi:hypothetical protein
MNEVRLIALILLPALWSCANVHVTGAADGGAGGMGGSGGMGGVGGISCLTAIHQCDDYNECTLEECEADTGRCIYVKVPDREPCEIEGTASACQSGLCVLPEAAAFCASYEEICGFGGAEHYEDEVACLAQYAAASIDKRQCIEQHLGFAIASDPQIHCPHAAGAAPCDL